MYLYYEMHFCFNDVPVMEQWTDLRASCSWSYFSIWLRMSSCSSCTARSAVTLAASATVDYG